MDVSNQSTTSTPTQTVVPHAFMDSDCGAISSSSEQQISSGISNQGDTTNLNPSRLQEIRLKAVEYASIGDYSGAIRLFTHMIHQLQTDSNNAELALAFSSRASALFEIGAYEASEMDCREALSLVLNMGEEVNENQQAHFQVAHGSLQAIRILLLLGTSLLRQGLSDDALKFFNEAIATSKSSLECNSRVFQGEEHSLNQALIHDLLAEAVARQSDARDLSAQMELISQSEQEPSSDGFLSSVQTALLEAPGCLKLQETMVSVLVANQEWEKTARFCQQLACLNSRVAGVFTGPSLQGQNPFLVSKPPKRWTSTYFGGALNPNDATMPNLESEAASEAVVWLPPTRKTILQSYIKSLWLENDCEAAIASLSVLETLGGARKSSWLWQERCKVRQTEAIRGEANEFFQFGKFGCALQAYERCLDEIDSKTGKIVSILQNNKSACLMAMGRFFEALKECTVDCNVYTQQYAKALLRKTRCHAQLCCYREAAEGYCQFRSMLQKSERDEREGKEELWALYKALDISIVSSDNDIKQAYRRMVLRFHPDKTSDPTATEQFHQIQAAYESLKDPKKRLKYNKQMEQMAAHRRTENAQIEKAEQMDILRNQVEQTSSKTKLSGQELRAQKLRSEWEKSVQRKWRFVNRRKK